MKYRKTIESFFGLLEEKNIGSWIDLWEDNAVCNFPFSNKLFDSKLVGKTEIQEFWSGSPDLYDSISLTVKDIFEKEQSAVVFFKNHSKLKAESVTYEDLNIGLFKFSDNNKIQEYHEFFDAINLGKIFKIIDLTYLD